MLVLARTNLCNLSSYFLLSAPCGQVRGRRTDAEMKHGRAAPHCGARISLHVSRVSAIRCPPPSFWFFLFPVKVSWATATAPHAQATTTTFGFNVCSLLETPRDCLLSSGSGRG